MLVPLLLMCTALCNGFSRQHRRFLRSQFGNENGSSRAESALALLVESGAFYFCIWVHFNCLLYLTSILTLPLAANICYRCGIELARGAFLPCGHRSTRRKISLPLSFVRQSQFLLLGYLPNDYFCRCHDANECYRHLISPWTSPINSGICPLAANCSTFYTSYGYWEFLGHRFLCRITRRQVKQNADIE